MAPALWAVPEPPAHPHARVHPRHRGADGPADRPGPDPAGALRAVGPATPGAGRVAPAVAGASYPGAGVGAAVAPGVPVAPLPGVRRLLTSAGAALAAGPPAPTTPGF